MTLKLLAIRQSTLLVSFAAVMASAGCTSAATPVSRAAPEPEEQEASAALQPDGQPDASPDSRPDRSAPPQLGPPPSLTLAPIQRFELSNGLPVVLLEKHEVPLVQLNLLVKTGTVDDPSGKWGLAEMTAEMLDEGAGGKGALALADAIDFLGAEISTWSDHHGSGVDVLTPLAKLDDALSLMADVALRPDFPAEELERRRLDTLTELLQARDETRTIAAVQFDRTLFGADHPYGRTATEATLRAINTDDLRGFHQRGYHPGNSTLIVVGDVTVDGVRERLETAFGGWQAGTGEPGTVEAVRQVSGRKLYLVDKPGAAQSEIRMGRIGAARSTEDYYALTVMNTVLGGSFTSRLNSNLREDKGYSYGAGSRFYFRPVPGPFMASSAVQTDVTDKALVEFMKELRGIGEISDEELLRAKNYVALRFPQRFQAVSRIASQLQEMVRYDLPSDYFNRYVERVLAIGMDDVKRVAASYVDPDNLAIVVVGDREVIVAGVEALNLGPIQYLTIGDVLGPAPQLGGE